MLTTISTLAQSLMRTKSSNEITQLEEHLRAYAKQHLQALANSEAAVDDFVLQVLAHVLSRSISGSAEDFIGSLLLTYKYSYKHSGKFFPKLSGAALNARPEKVMTQSEAITTTLANESIDVQVLTRGVLLHPERINPFLARQQLPLEVRMRVSLHLKVILESSVCNKKEKLTMTVRDTRKALLFQYLHEIHPAMLVLLFKLGETGDFVDICRLFSGQSITFPNIDEMEEAISETTRTQKVPAAYEALLQKVNITEENSVPLQVFIEHAIKHLFAQSAVTLDELQEHLADIDQKTLLRLYASLNNSFNTTSKFAADMLQDSAT